MQPQPQPQYLGSLISYARTFVTSNYAKLPIKPPQFVTNSVVLADSYAKPYVEELSQMVDSNIQKSVQFYEDKLALAGSLKQKGLEITESLKDQSKKAIDSGLKYSATQLVVSTCDRVADLVFTQIEKRVEQLQKVVSHGKSATKIEGNQSYQRRVATLVHNLTDLSCGLVTLIKGEFQQLGGQGYVRLETMIKRHAKATLYTVRLFVYTPALELVQASKERLLEYLLTLKDNFSINEIYSILSTQIQQISAWSKARALELQKTLLELLSKLNLVKLAKQQSQIVFHEYKKQLEVQEEQTQPPRREESSEQAQRETAEILKEEDQEHPDDQAREE